MMNRYANLTNENYLNQSLNNLKAAVISTYANIPYNVSNATDAEALINYQNGFSCINLVSVFLPCLCARVRLCAYTLCLFERDLLPSSTFGTNVKFGKSPVRFRPILGLPGALFEPCDLA